MITQDLEQEIERTREHLGQTVDELAAKADMKARARVKAAEVKARARERAAVLTRRVRQSQVVRRRWPLAVAAGVLLAGSVAIRRWRKT
jgi:septal ring factor EnvC (AmiA/AmiB activator)